MRERARQTFLARKAKRTRRTGASGCIPRCAPWLAPRPMPAAPLSAQAAGAASVRSVVLSEQLTKKQKDMLSYIIESQHVIDSDLKKGNRENLETLVEIQSFKGIRHSKGLPVRGQRTSTNSKTQKRLGSSRLRRR